MTTLTPFHYRHGTSRLHALDARFKIVLLIMFSLSILKASVAGLLGLTLLTICLLAHLRIPLMALLSELRYFMILLAIIFIFRIISTQGDPLFQTSWVAISRPGVLDGGLVCWRLLMVVLMGFVFVSTTRIATIRWSVQWLLAPVPLVPERRLATMMGLIVRFIPVIFQKAHTISDAQKARCVACRKSPFYRLKVLTLPLMRGVFQDADKLAMAMMARCYDEDQTLPPPQTRPNDWLALGAGGLFCFLLFVI